MEDLVFYEARPLRIEFVCLGNICRSPMADVIFRAMAERAGVAERFVVTSSGIGDWHKGQPADPRTVSALARAGYDGSAHRAQQITAENIERADVYIALDRSHQRALTEMGAKKVHLLTEFDDIMVDPDVFDPYHSDDGVFDDVLQQIERSCGKLLGQLTNTSTD